jgi:mRNA-degrading endonuclease YafQ of YafQ-DinJ toxin-antitoxin module
MKIDKKLMDDLYEQQKEKRGELAKISKAIESLREICDHDWKYKGHTSHEDCYECIICGESKFT